jgi:hypothetical protein
VKRHPSLRPLSDDHHRALVLARRLRREPAARDPDSLAGLASEVREAFDDDLEPHFVVEETRLLPPLDEKGAADLAERTRADHAALRGLVHGRWSEATAGRIGERLEAHVRFEERVLFPRAEAILSDAELAAVRDAMPAGKAKGGDG